MRGELFDRMVSLVFPRGCVLCGATVAYDDFVCPHCLSDRTNGALCLFCGQERIGCHCGEEYLSLSGAAAALYYREETRRAILRLKQLPDRRIARYLAGEMHQCLEQRFPDVCFDLVTEVPMHPGKLEKRGFNQAELLAGQFAALSGIFHRMRLLACSGPEEYQHTLGRQERFAAAHDRYSLIGDVKGKTLLLIDDIFTTGATAQACATCLMDGGARAVYILTAAATPLQSAFV